MYISTSLSVGGAEIMLLKLLQNINRSSFEPAVISLGKKGKIGKLLIKNKIKVYSLGINSTFQFILGIFRLYKRIQKFRPQIVQTWMYHADLFGGIIARLAGVTTIVWGIRNSNLCNEKTKWLTQKIVQLCAYLSKVVPTQILSCSARAAQIHAELGYFRPKIKIIPNGFDLETFKPNKESRLSVRKELGLKSGALLVGLIARHDPQKNHKGFIRAAKYILKENKNVYFVFAGSGIEKQNAEFITELLGYQMADRFHFLGQRNDVPRLMAAIDVNVSSSSYGEAFPNILGEAMACGVPCVVTDVGDSAKIVGDTGRVVQANNMDSLGENILDILKMSPKNRRGLGRRARARIKANFEIKQVSQVYENFYKMIIK